MGPIQTYKLLYSKGNHKQNEKTTHRLGENICKLCDQKGLNFQNHKQLIQCNTKKKKKPNQKWAEDPDISPKETNRWPAGT